MSLAGNIYMAGIGGMGMAPLAILLRESGCEVAGFDDALAEPVRKALEAAGVVLTDTPEPPDAAELVVRTSALAESHPSMQAALARGVPVIRRGECLAKAAEGRKLLAVAGSHGKTSTAAMLIWALRQAGFDCGWALGAFYEDNALPPARQAMPGKWLVAEIDESDGTIDGFCPDAALIVNIDWDHPERYRTRESIEQAFSGLISRTREAVFIPHGCEALDRMARKGANGKTYTFGEKGDYVGSMEIASSRSLRLSLNGCFSPRSEIVRAIGGFNGRNALAALAAARWLDAEAAGALESYPGVARRQSMLMESPTLSICEDYAHHPAEIAALIQTARETWPRRQLIAVFQPHRHTRTCCFKAELAHALAGVDQLALLDVYAASEQPVDGGMIEDLQASFPTERRPDVYRARNALFCVLSKWARAMPTTLLYIGAGDICHWARDGASRFSRLDRMNEEWSRLKRSIGEGSRMSNREPLAEKTTMRVGGPASHYIEPVDESALQAALTAAKRAGADVFILGRGSNVIVSDEGFDGLVIRLNSPRWREVEPLEGDRLRCMAGARLKQICSRACSLGLEGFEFLEGIPGTMGGALRMNAGAMDGWTLDIVESVELMTMEGERRTLMRENLRAAYRECVELREAVALSATLKAPSRASAEAIRGRIEEYAIRRKSSQPREPSAGCIFKNPDGHSAGKMIDELGLKGQASGGAQISRTHANFIVNAGGASCADVVSLMRLVRRQARERHGVDLEPEALLLGGSWSERL